MLDLSYNQIKRFPGDFADAFIGRLDRVVRTHHNADVEINEADELDADKRYRQLTDLFLRRAEEDEPAEADPEAVEREQGLKAFQKARRGEERRARRRQDKSRTKERR
mmetsp:Transcript_65538/g.154810  ORF Transcript_65538/g.154810 Transcript_65538/m.154810 type:complete len:108 (-) Transcript_65538:171-494(-)